MLNITASNIDKEVTNSTTPVIVDFWASWCGPCKLLGPVFEELSNEYTGKLKFAKLNTEEDGELAEKFDISGIPCMVVFKNGEEVDRIVGFAPKPALKQKIDAIMKNI